MASRRKKEREPDVDYAAIIASDEKAVVDYPETHPERAKILQDIERMKKKLTPKSKE